MEQKPFAHSDDNTDWETGCSKRTPLQAMGLVRAPSAAHLAAPAVFQLFIPAGLPPHSPSSPQPFLPAALRPWSLVVHGWEEGDGFAHPPPHLLQHRAASHGDIWDGGAAGTHRYPGGCSLSPGRELQPRHLYHPPEPRALEGSSYTREMGLSKAHHSLVSSAWGRWSLRSRSPVEEPVRGAGRSAGTSSDPRLSRQ